MPPTRWSNLRRHGFLGTGLLGLAATAAAAEPCDPDDDRVIGLVIGVEVAPRAGFMMGVEVRKCIDPDVEAIVRIEARRGYPRVVGGLRVTPFEDDGDTDGSYPFALDGGLALDLDGQLGLHAGALLGHRIVFGGVQANLPITATLPTRWTLVGGLAPWAYEPQVVSGRPIVRDGRYLRPAFAAPLPRARDREDRAVRDHFASSAQLELSSVWTFLRLAAELAAVGAPAALVARALDAADDEVRHAEACAAAAGGVTLRPLPDGCAAPRFAARSPQALATLAAEAWREGCLEETAAAEEARLAAAEAHGPIASMLGTIARDEAGHAALAWDVLAWVVSIAPEAAAAIAREPAPAAPRAGRADAGLVQRGVASAAMTAAARAHAASAAGDRLAALIG